MPSAGNAASKSDKAKDKETVKQSLSSLSIPGGTNMRRSDLKLPTQGGDGTVITWKSSAPAYIDNSGKILKRAPKGSGKHEVTSNGPAKKNKAKESRKFKAEPCRRGGL